MLLLSFEKYCPEYEIPGSKTCGLWTLLLNAETAIYHEETLQLTGLSSHKDLESALFLREIRKGIFK
jgi:hypothetical protein